MRKKLGRAAAWVVTIGLLGYLLTTVSPREVARAVGQAAPWTVPVLAGLIVLVYLADSLAIWRTFGWFLVRLSFRDVLVVRGASYLLAIINYAVGQGAIVYFVNRSRGIPIMKGAGAVLLVMGINVLLLLAISSVGLAITPQVPRELTVMVVAGWLGLAGYVALQLVRPRWLVSRPLFEVLFGAGLSDHLKALAIRLPHLCALMVLTYTSFRAFGIEVPVAQALLFLPIVFFVAVLPISVQGWGPTQWAMMTFFARYAPGNDPRAVVFAASATTQALALAVQALIGVICLRNQLARDLAREPAPPG